MILRHAFLLVLLLLMSVDATAESTIREEQEPANSTVSTRPNLLPGKEAITRTYDRFPFGFHTQSSFAFGHINWSGAGHRVNEVHHVTMITPKFGVSSAHNGSGGSSWIFRFHDTSSVFSFEQLTRNKHERILPAGPANINDVLLARFSSPLTSGYQVYPVYRKSGNSYTNQEFVLFGQSSSDADPDNVTGAMYEDGNLINQEWTTSQKFGTNTVAGMYEGGKHMKFVFDEPSNPKEFFVRQNTSGGGIFKIIGGNKPIVAGVIGGQGANLLTASSSDDTTKDTTWVVHDLTLKIDDGSTFGANNVGFYRDELNTKVKDWQDELSIDYHLQDRVVFYTENSSGSHMKGDFNGNFALDADDLDILTREANMRLSQNRAYNWYLDQDNDGDIDQADVKKVMQDANAFNTKYGDLNADGNYTTAEQNTFFTHFNQSGKSWATGDFNGDGNCDNADFLLILETL